MPASMRTEIADLHTGDRAGVTPEYAHGALDTVVPSSQGPVVRAAHRRKRSDLKNGLSGQSTNGGARLYKGGGAADEKRWMREGPNFRRMYHVWPPDTSL